MPRHLEEQEQGDDPGRRAGREAHGDVGDIGDMGAMGDMGDPDAAAPAAASPAAAAAAMQRVQTGVRMEKRLVKVLKALAELYDRSLGDLLEGIVLHAFAGRSPFSAESLRRIAELERIYGLDLAARAGERPLEPGEPRS